MSWGLITDDWRIKLLALGLAVLMLGAVAFSQNPPTTGNLTVGLLRNANDGISLFGELPHRLSIETKLLRKASLIQPKHRL